MDLDYTRTEYEDPQFKTPEEHGFRFGTRLSLSLAEREDDNKDTIIIGCQDGGDEIAVMIGKAEAMHVAQRIMALVERMKP